VTTPLWLISTRHRPHAIAALIEACRAAGELPEAAVMIDGDCHEYDGVDWPAHWTVHRSEEHRELSASQNALWALHRGRSAYCVSPDHARPRSAGWFSRLCAAAGDWGIAYSEDNWMHGLWPEDLHPHKADRRHLTGGIVLGGRLVETLGWIMPPGLVHLYTDNVLEELASALDLWRWCPDVLVENDHPANPRMPAQPDGNTRRVFRGESYPAKDRAEFGRWLTQDYGRTVDRLRAEMVRAA
jgi:hypothetical protein